MLPSTLLRQVFGNGIASSLDVFQLSLPHATTSAALKVATIGFLEICPGMSTGVHGARTTHSHDRCSPASSRSQASSTATALGSAGGLPSRTLSTAARSWLTLEVRPQGEQQGEGQPTALAMERTCGAHRQGWLGHTARENRLPEQSLALGHNSSWVQPAALNQHPHSIGSTVATTRCFQRQHGWSLSAAGPWQQLRAHCTISATPDPAGVQQPTAGAAAQASRRRVATQDMIHIRGARFYGYHGVLPAENAVGQPFIVDVSLTCDLRAAGRTDDLKHTVSYAEVFTCVQRIMEGRPHALLESLAHTVAGQILAAHGAVEAVRVSINKAHIPNLSAAVQSVGVEVLRTREDF